MAFFFAWLTAIDGPAKSRVYHDLARKAAPAVRAGRARGKLAGLRVRQERKTPGLAGGGRPVGVAGRPMRTRLHSDTGAVRFSAIRRSGRATRSERRRGSDRSVPMPTRSPLPEAGTGKFRAFDTCHRNHAAGPSSRAGSVPRQFRAAWPLPPPSAPRSQAEILGIQVGVAHKRLSAPRGEFAGPPARARGALSGDGPTPPAALRPTNRGRRRARCRRG